MPIQIGQRPDHGFDEPLGLLSDCHRRIEHFLEVLATVAVRAAGGPLTPEYRRAIDGSLRYFTVAAPRHTADEEDSLFPRLRALATGQAADVLASLDRLEHDHDTAEADHAAVDGLFRRWLADDRLAPADVDHLRERLDRLQALYQRHIALEDQQLFPLAARLLDATQVKEMGEEMASRRSVDILRG